MTHEDELRSLESMLAGYKETIKEVNRLGGDGMASVRAEWLLRITELELQREHLSSVVRRARRAALVSSSSLRVGGPGAGGGGGASPEHADSLRVRRGDRATRRDVGGFGGAQKPRFRGGTPAAPRSRPFLCVGSAADWARGRVRGVRRRDLFGFVHFLGWFFSGGGELWGF